MAEGPKAGLPKVLAGDYSMKFGEVNSRDFVLKLIAGFEMTIVLGPLCQCQVVGAVKK